MKREVTASLWAAHRALGVFLGALLFLIFATGTVCTFRDELRLWSSPVAQAGQGQALAAPNGAQIERVVEQFAQHHPLTTVPRWAIFLPFYEDGAYELIYADKQHRSLVRAFVGDSDLRYLGEAARTPGEFLFNLHANLSFRGRIGRISVGLLGLGALFLALTGFLIHRHKLRNAFTFRPGQTLRKTLGDTHRAVGLWGFAFFVMISFSGALLGLKSILLVAPTAVQFKGDFAKAKEVLTPAQVRRKGEPMIMAPVPELWDASMELAQANAEASTFVPTLLSAWAWGDFNAQWVVAGSLPGQLAPQNEGMRVRLYAGDASPLELESVLEHPAPRRVLSTMSPLHYGDFGGWPLKFLYAALGFGGLVLIGSGLMIWAQRSAKPKASA